MNTKAGLIVIMALLLALALGGCGADAPTSAVPEATETPGAPSVPKAQTPDPGDLPLTEDVSVYKDDAPESLAHFYVTVRRGRDADRTDHTLAEVNAVVNLQDMVGVEMLKSEVIFREGDENGPQPGLFGFGATEPNGTIRLRGKTSTLAAQKSYRIDLFDGAGLWRGQRAIALLKHASDPSRLRNKLYFDLLKDVPDMTSLRTQFARLYVLDQTEDTSAAEYVDYGLFTFIETPNKRFLRNHGLSRDGNLYKANMFEYYRYEDKLKLATDPTFDQATFDTVLETKNGNDHTKLIAMLDDLNDYSIPIERTIEKHFNPDNLMSFVAYNLLMGNADFNSQNFLLYSPVNVDTWYVLPWDGDDSLHFASDRIMQSEDPMTWQRGIANVWGVVLFNRMLRVEKYRDLLVERVERLHRIVTPERIRDMITQYRRAVDPFTHRMPDLMHLPTSLDKMELIYERMPFDTDLAYEHIQASLKTPMPFYLDDVAQTEDGALRFRWDDSYSFTPQIVYYHLQVASDWTFAPESLVHEQAALVRTEHKIPAPPAGEYWWRVVSSNQDGFEQIAFDATETPEGIHAGMRKFTVGADGKVANPT